MSETPEAIRVLVVDDEPDLLDLAAAHLERESERLSVVTAGSAREGLERLEESHIDCVVSDYDMPGTDGLEFLEAVVETSIDGIHVVDEDRNIVTYNQRFVEMWDIPGSAIERRSSERALVSVLDMVEDPDGFVEKIRYLYDHPEEESRDRVILRDGRVFDRYSAPVTTGGDTGYGRVWFYRDITETIERERELERQNARLDEFVGVISHDLRGPLNVAQGRLDMARAESDSDHLDGIADAHDRMVTLIEDLLTLAKEGRTVGERDAVDVDRVATRAWDVLETREAELSVATDRTLEADASRLQQLFENLFRNAVEHAGPACTVRVGSLEDDPGVFVEDDGPGIDADDPERVFDSGYSTSEAGTGFGLAIVKQIAEAHGWTVGATAAPDGGARFELRVDPRT